MSPEFTYSLEYVTNECKSNSEKLIVDLHISQPIKLDKQFQIHIQEHTNFNRKIGVIEYISDSLGFLRNTKLMQDLTFRSKQLKILAETYGVSTGTIRTHYNRMLETKGHK